MPRRQLRPKRHEVLVNKKSGKISSSNNEVNILCVQVYQSGDNAGIMTPYYNAGKKLSKSNTIQIKRMRKPKCGNLHQIIQQQAQDVLVPLAVLYDLHRAQHLSPSRIKFAKWVSKELNTQGSEAYNLALDYNANDLLETSRGFQWWLEQLKNYRVKHMNKPIR